MKQATLQLADGPFERSKAGVVSGEISLRIDGLHLPVPQWTDAVVVVMTWWCAALARVLQGEAGPIDVRFMDGPYRAELGPLDRNALSLVLAEAGLGQQILFRNTVDVGSLVLSTLSTAERIMVECKNRDWWTPDEDALLEVWRQLHQGARQRLNESAISLA